MLDAVAAPTEALSDAHRLQVLRRTGLLDSPPEEVFDCATRLASRALGAPIALISLLDSHRQFFKSAVGLPAVWAASRQTPITHSFCQHVLTQSKYFSFEDATSNPYLCAHPGFTQLGIAAYAGAPLILHDGVTLGAICVADGQAREWPPDAQATLQDIAALTINEIERRLVLADLHDADRRKNDFVSTLAHELRNPLAPIRNATNLLQRPRLKQATVREAARIIDRQLHQIVRLVDDLLDIGRIARDVVVLQRQRISLAEILSLAIESSVPAFDARGVAFCARIPKQSIWLDADRTRLVQIVTNLLANAEKFTPRGGRVDLEAWLEADEAVIEVRDSGIGIDSNAIERIFGLFEQVPRDDGLPPTEGLGIGLALARRFAELHGGSINARSAGPGQGSAFTVRLPARQRTD